MCRLLLVPWRKCRRLLVPLAKESQLLLALRRVQPSVPWKPLQQLGFELLMVLDVCLELGFPDKKTLLQTCQIHLQRCEPLRHSFLISRLGMHLHSKLVLAPACPLRFLWTHTILTPAPSRSSPWMQPATHAIQPRNKLLKVCDGPCAATKSQSSTMCCVAIELPMATSSSSFNRAATRLSIFLSASFCVACFFKVSAASNHVQAPSVFWHLSPSALPRTPKFVLLLPSRLLRLFPPLVACSSRLDCSSFP